MGNEQPSSTTTKTSFKRVVAAVGLSALPFGLGGYGVGHYVHRSPPPPQAYFSPNGGCTQAITAAIDRATSDVFVQAYYFTSVDIADSLIRAKGRGVQVSVLMDKSCRTDQWSLARYLADRGITVKVDDMHDIAHNKVILIDGQTLLTGSFNFTKAAEDSNAENLLLLKHPETVSQYRTNWQTHWNHGHPFKQLFLANVTDPIMPDVASAHDGQQCTVEMTVAKVGVNPNNPTQVFLNSRRYYKDAGNFTIALSPGATPKAFDSWAAFRSFLPSLEGKTVRVVGVVARYEGRPEIEVRNPDQLIQLPGIP